MPCHATPCPEPPRTEPGRDFLFLRPVLASRDGDMDGTIDLPKEKKKGGGGRGKLLPFGFSSAKEMRGVIGDLIGRKRSFRFIAKKKGGGVGLCAFFPHPFTRLPFFFSFVFHQKKRKGKGERNKTKRVFRFLWQWIICPSAGVVVFLSPPFSNRFWVPRRNTGMCTGGKVNFWEIQKKKIEKDQVVAERLWSRKKEKKCLLCHHLLVPGSGGNGRERWLSLPVNCWPRFLVMADELVLSL